MSVSYNNDNPLTMKKLADRLDALEDGRPAPGEAAGPAIPADGIVGELKRIADAEEEANRRRKTMNATHVTRIVLEVLLVIALGVFAVGCTNDWPGLIMGQGNGGGDVVVLPDLELPDVPSKPGDSTSTGGNIGRPDAGNGNASESHDVGYALKGTRWICEPVLVEGMEVVGIEFDAELDEGRVVFTSRGAKRFRLFDVTEAGLVFSTPESVWSVGSDHSERLSVTAGDGSELKFTRSV